MSLSPYRRVLAEAPLRLTLLLGVLVRIPVAAGGLILTLHVVAMGRSYGEAGVATMILTTGLALSGPWRGRLLDRLGLRRVVLPSLVVLAGCWTVAPRLDYLPLLAVCALAGLFTIPSFSIIRQAVIAAVPDHDRRTALALDSVAVEISFMLGPILGVWAATTWPTGTVLMAVGLGGVLAGAVLWLVNPPMRGPQAPEDDAADVDEQGRHRPRTWFTPGVAAVFLAAVATTLVLSGTDLSVVAAARDFGATAQVGIVLALWCLGSLVGGLWYGAQSRAMSPLWLLFGLGAVTLPVAFARDVPTLTALVVVAGLFCAPVTTAMVDQLSRLVPEVNRGEAMGWQGSFMQIGSALGAPLAGAAIDHGGYAAGFAVVAASGMTMALAGLAVVRLRRAGGGGRRAALA
ncbi:MAG: MFS transporter [Austwickia sp.]|jgi:predicted MFS family arabinose efflux permease|nr:MAG: MFS transporter [Austwickia sp.]